MDDEAAFSLASVPAFLRSTALYLTFIEDEEPGNVTLPAKYCAFDVFVNTPEQFQSILSTLHFWGSTKYQIKCLTLFFQMTLAATHKY